LLPKRPSEAHHPHLFLTDKMFYINSDSVVIRFKSAQLIGQFQVNREANNAIGMLVVSPCKKQILVLLSVCQINNVVLVCFYRLDIKQTELKD